MLCPKSYIPTWLCLSTVPTNLSLLRIYQFRQKSAKTCIQIPDSEGWLKFPDWGIVKFIYEDNFFKYIFFYIINTIDLKKFIWIYIYLYIFSLLTLFHENVLLCYKIFVVSSSSLSYTSTKYTNFKPNRAFYKVLTVGMYVFKWFECVVMWGNKVGLSRTKCLYW